MNEPTLEQRLTALEQRVTKLERKPRARRKSRRRDMIALDRFAAVRYVRLSHQRKEWRDKQGVLAWIHKGYRS